MHLSQHKLCTRKMELAFEVKYDLDFHWVTRPWRRTLTNGSDVKYAFPRCQAVPYLSRHNTRSAAALIRALPVFIFLFETLPQQHFCTDVGSDVTLITGYAGVVLVHRVEKVFLAAQNDAVGLCHYCGLSFWHCLTQGSAKLIHVRN